MASRASPWAFTYNQDWVSRWNGGGGRRGGRLGASLTARIETSIFDYLLACHLLLVVGGGLGGWHGLYARQQCRVVNMIYFHRLQKLFCHGIRSSDRTATMRLCLCLSENALRPPVQFHLFIFHLCIDMSTRYMLFTCRFNAVQT